MLHKLSDIPQWQNNTLDLFPLSIYGGEISKLNPEDQIGDELDKLWKNIIKATKGNASKFNK